MRYTPLYIKVFSTPLRASSSKTLLTSLPLSSIEDVPQLLEDGTCTKLLIYCISPEIVISPTSAELMGPNS